MYPVPHNEAQRIATLHQYGLLDTAGSVSFDAIAGLACATLDASMAMISLVDERRQWFLASRGVDVSETPRETAFCNYPVALDEPLLVRDASADSRFASYPTVMGEPGIRSYAGSPVHAANGMVLGTVCAIDRQPEKFGQGHVTALRSLAVVVEHLFSAHLGDRTAPFAGTRGTSPQDAPQRVQVANRNRARVRPLLLLFALNGIAQIHDGYGRLYVDLVLAEVDRRLNRHVPDGQVSREGDGVFSVLLPADLCDDSAIARARDLLRLIAEPIRIGNASLEIHATCGIARCTSRDSADDQLRQARRALQLGITNPDQRIHIYNAALDGGEQARIAATDEVYSALKKDRIFVGYQPIVDLRSRAIVGYEALMRVSQPDGRVLTAGQLQPALLNLDISRQVAHRMASLVSAEFALLSKITNAQATPANGLPKPDHSPFYVSLNATGHNLLHDNFAPMLLETIAKHGIAPSSITLEVTETMLITDLERASAVLHGLKAEGVTIALDDFGTGFSSLTHLNKFPIDKVKIDRSFVMDIVHDRNARSIVAAVLAMARSLSIDVIAEGIEDEAQLAILRQMGCALGQGYLLGRPQGLSTYLAKSLNHAARQQNLGKP